MAMRSSFEAPFESGRAIRRRVPYDDMKFIANNWPEGQSLRVGDWFLVDRCGGSFVTLTTERGEPLPGMFDPRGFEISKEDR